MNVFFAGYRKWAFAIAKGLVETKSSKWHLTGTLSPNSTEADFSALPIPSWTIDPTQMHTLDMLHKIAAEKPDVILFYGWSWMIPKEIYNTYLCLILHPSPLPKYRGGSPLQHQIINGEKISAVTILQVTDGLDAGAIYSQTLFSLSGTLQQIFSRIEKTGLNDTKKVLDGISDNTLTPFLQDDSSATVFRRRKPEDSEITNEALQKKTGEELYNFIRALSDPYPNAYIVGNDNKKVYIKSAALEE